MNYDSYRGVLNADLSRGIVPSGDMDIPMLFRTHAIPNKLVAFDKALHEADRNQWVHFYIHDRQFQRIWRDPWRYLQPLARFNGVIAPDFSVFWNVARYKQFESVCHSREIASWLQRNAIPVIPSIRWGKEDTYQFSFSGIETGGTVSVGNVGCLREREARQVFDQGFLAMLDIVRPENIVIYGSERFASLQVARERGIGITSFPSNTQSFRKEVA